jgi:DNA-binding MarR family transcriptional regulator
MHATIEMCARARKWYGAAMSTDREPYAAWRALLLAQSRALRAIEADLDRAGVIPLTWYDVLLELNSAPDRRLRMADLGLRVVLSRTRVSRLVAELEAKGLVTRVPDPSDGRATLATITPEGRAELRRAAPVYLDGIDRHFTRYLSTPQQAAIVDGLQRVIDAHGETIDPRR